MIRFKWGIGRKDSWWFPKPIKLQDIGGFFWFTTAKFGPLYIEVMW